MKSKKRKYAISPVTIKSIVGGYEYPMRDSVELDNIFYIKNRDVILALLLDGEQELADELVEHPEDFWCLKNNERCAHINEGDSRNFWKIIER